MMTITNPADIKIPFHKFVALKNKKQINRNPNVAIANLVTGIKNTYKNINKINPRKLTILSGNTWYTCLYIISLNNIAKDNINIIIDKNNGNILGEDSNSSLIGIANDCLIKITLIPTSSI